MRNTDTKTRILTEALRLFAVSGYEAVTVEQISAAVGIKAPSLYKHYKSKRDIFDHIVLRMQEGDADKAGEHRMPDSNERAAEELTPLERIRQYSIAMFRYWTEEEFPSCFRRMLTLEQYRDPKLAQLHRDYLAGGPLEYMAAIFRRLTDTDEEAMQLALDFYGPMYLLYSVYDAAEEKETVAPMLAAHIRRFIARIETGYRWNGETDFEGGERLL